MLTFNHVQAAWQSLRSNRLRTMLTMLGVTIGVASITTILALTNGANTIISNQVDAIGGNIAVVRPQAPPNEVLQFSSGQQQLISSLTELDITTLEKIPNVTAVAPIMQLGGAVTGNTPAPFGTPIVATTPSFIDISQFDVAEGQFLDPKLNPATAVIGAQLSIDIFGTEQSIGKTVNIRDKPFTVIGVLKRTNAPIHYNQVDIDRSVVIGYEIGKVLNHNAPSVQQINIQSDSVTNLDKVIVESNKALLKNHLDQADFAILSGESIAQPMSNVFAIIAGASVAIAGISLLVGGVGIMNIMLVSVSERTREIGIRKALGATNSDIVAQFLIEALCFSIGGALLGLIFGYIGAFAISMLLPFDPLLSWSTVGTAFAISLITGMLFGLYPAIKASQKDPITALKQFN